jgi:uncharacterized protein YbdZ (MbtH family)
MTNPFEDDDREYLVLLNAESQRSLWPASIAVPGGWEIEFKARRQDCLDYVAQHWLDMRPTSLVRMMDGVPTSRDN